MFDLHLIRLKSHDHSYQHSFPEIHSFDVHLLLSKIKGSEKEHGLYTKGNPWVFFFPLGDKLRKVISQSYLSFTNQCSFFFNYLVSIISSEAKVLIKSYFISLFYSFLIT